MTGNCFFDTNILIYIITRDDPIKRQTAIDLLKLADRLDTGRSSLQVAQEVLNVSTRKLQKVLTTEDALEFVERIVVPFIRSSSDFELLREAMRIQARYQISFDDALIVASASRQGCTTLYTEDLQDGMMFGDLRVVNPFVKG